MLIRPMLATDAVESKIKFPCVVQPKIDGVRGLVQDGTLYARSLKKIPNVHVSRCYSHSQLNGLDGELAIMGEETSPTLCRDTVSAVRSADGEPKITWHLFDYVTEETRNLTYVQRYDLLHVKYANELRMYPEFALVPSTFVSTLDQLLEAELVWLDSGYEGIIIRDPFAAHKDNRSTVREGGLLRIKRFVEEDAVVVDLEEAFHNTNEQQYNERGYAFRSNTVDAKLGAGRIGVLICKKQDGTLIRVSPAMTHQQATEFWQNPASIIGRGIVYKHFPKGVKDLPRFPIRVRFEGENE